MKKLNLKRKVFWGGLGGLTLITPLVIVGAVACVPQAKPFNKSNIVINTNSVNGTLFINQNENLPTLSAQATVDNQNVQLAYQWYESDSNSTTNGKAIAGATQSTYTLSESDTQKLAQNIFMLLLAPQAIILLYLQKFRKFSQLKYLMNFPKLMLTCSQKTKW